MHFSSISLRYLLSSVVLSIFQKRSELNANSWSYVIRWRLVAASVVVVVIEIGGDGRAEKDTSSSGHTTHSHNFVFNHGPRHLPPVKTLLHHPHVLQRFLLLPLGQGSSFSVPSTQRQRQRKRRRNNDSIIPPATCCRRHGEQQ